MCKKAGPSSNYPYHKIESLLSVIWIKSCKDPQCSDCIVTSRAQNSVCTTRLGTIEKYILHDDFLQPPPFIPNGYLYKYSVVYKFQFD